MGIVGPLSAAFLVNTFLGRRWMMGISSIVTGVFLFAYVGVETPKASLAFSCITGLLGNFGMFSLEVAMARTNPSRICSNVCIYPRVLSRSSSRYWHRDGGISAASGRTGCQLDFVRDRIHSSTDLCQCRTVGGCRGDLFRPTVRNSRACSYLVDGDDVSRVPRALDTGLRAYKTAVCCTNVGSQVGNFRLHQHHLD